jgi:Stress responsive A/B Barrel Domain
MITHLVLMKPRADVSAGDGDRFVTAFEDAVREISAVRAVRVGRRVIHGAQYERATPDAGDFMLLIDFDDLQGLQTYLRHPAHHAVGEAFGLLLVSGWVFDYETGDLTRLRELAQPMGGGR